jgi:nitrogen fixation protein FixH
MKEHAMLRRRNEYVRPVTGRTVLIWMIAFFGIIAAANAILIRAADTTFGGVETDNAYKAGLNFGRDIAAAKAQDHLHWRVDGRVDFDASGVATGSLTVNDARNRSLDGLEITGRLAHPTNRKLDRIFTLDRVSAGHYRGMVDATAGQWDFIVEIDRDAKRVFQSRTRIHLK